ncbi:MAG: methyltransferase domain-containing protein [Verrucomicrobiota bacterium]
MKQILKSIAGHLGYDPDATGTDNVATRENWLSKELNALPEGTRILDAGAGAQQYKRLCSHLDYVSQDFAAYDGKGDGSGMQTGSYDYGKLDIISDITDIPEPDKSFDAVMCIEVLEHVPHPIAALTELSRLLRPGGKIILSAPFCSITHYAPYHFHTGLTRYWYETHLSHNDIQIDRIIYNGDFFQVLAQELRRTPEMAKQYGPYSLNLAQRFFWGCTIKTLSRLSRNCPSSSEMLCYGLQVSGTKK